MKKLILVLPALVISALFFLGCQETTSVVDPLLNKQSVSANSFGSGAYTITLVSHDQNADGNWEWIWTIQNNNPGNGNNGTYQNLSHWVFNPGACLIVEDIVSAAYSGDGSNYTEIPAPFAFVQDPSFLNTCGVETGNVFKFNFGTTGSNLSYYKLVVNKNFDVDAEAVAYLKSGNNTGCGTMTFEGIGCETTELCYDNYNSAWGDGARYADQGNWATYTSYEGTERTVDLLAGQHIKVGSVHFSTAVDGKVTITISLESDWVLQDLDEVVHIQGYSDAPSGNPQPGKFQYKGTSLTVEVDQAKFYGVHVNVRQIVDCEQ